jgi:hypothetical protein
VIEESLAGKAFEIATGAVETAGRASSPWELVIFVAIVAAIVGPIILSRWD